MVCLLSLHWVNMVCLLYLQWVHVYGGLFNYVVAYYLIDVVFMLDHYVGLLGPYIIVQLS
jgi:hypothetical protein